jgi:hypothetical protein
MQLPSSKELQEPEATNVKRKPPLLERKLGEKKEFEIHGGLVGFYKGSTSGNIQGQNVSEDNCSGFGIVADLQRSIDRSFIVLSIAFSRPCLIG